MKIKSAIYARTSSDDKKNPKLSTENQIEACEKKADLNKYEFAQEHYIELSLSGSLPPTRWCTKKNKTEKNHRPELERLMADIDSDSVNAIFGLNFIL